MCELVVSTALALLVAGATQTDRPVPGPGPVPSVAGTETRRTRTTTGGPEGAPAASGMPTLIAPDPSSTPATAPLRRPELRRMELAPLGAEPATSDSARGERTVLERRRLGPDGETGMILGLPKTLKPVEQVYGDTTALSHNLRVMEDYGRPYPEGFKWAYEAPDSSGRFVRGNGALYAIYPYSTYKMVKKKGLQPQLPPGTLFHIGMPRDWMAQPPRAPERDEGPPGREATRIDGRVGSALTTRIDLRYDLYIPQGVQASPAREWTARIPATDRSDELLEQTTLDDGAPMPPIATDEDYRRQFFASLRRPT